MAELFKEVIQNEFSENFRNIIFAIINDHNAISDTNPEGNVTPFAGKINNKNNNKTKKNIK